MVIFLFFLANILSAQKKEKESEFSIYKYKPTPRDRVIFEFGHTGFLNMPYGLQETATSGGINILFYFDHPIKDSRFSFAWGAGFSSHNVHGKLQILYQRDSITNAVTYTTIEKRDEPYVVNRIGLKVIEIPVELRFRTRTKWQFKMMVGGKFGYVVHSFRKIIDKNSKAKYFDIEGINPWRYGIVLRIGIEQINLTAFYALSELFISGKGTPGVVPFSVGFAWTPRISMGSGQYKDDLLNK